MSNNSSESNQTKPISTAYHEAGHAVAATILGLTFTSVTIEPDEDSLGNCIHPSVFGYEYRGIRERKKIVRECIIVSYAGLQAEKIFNPKAEEWRSGEDKDSAFNLSREFCVLPKGCSCVGDEAHIEFLGKLQREARHLIRQHWSFVSTVAEALLNAKTLTGDQVEEIRSLKGQG